MLGGALPERVEGFERMLKATSAFAVRRPVFVIEELDQALGVCGRDAQRRRSRVLRRLVERGVLVRLMRWTYAAIERGDYGASVGHSSRVALSADRTLAYAIVGRMKRDAVLAYRTALEVHGAVRPALGRPMLFLTRSQHRRTRVVAGIVGQGIEHPRQLRARGRWRSGVMAVRCVEVPVRVTTRERTLVDVFDHGRFGGTWPELVGGAVRLLSGREPLDWEFVVNYARFIGRSSTAARVGWLLEQLRHSRGVRVPDDVLTALEAMRPKGPTYWDWLDRERDGESG